MKLLFSPRAGMPAFPLLPGKPISPALSHPPALPDRFTLRFGSQAAQPSDPGAVPPVIQADLAYFDQLLNEARGKLEVAKDPQEKITLATEALQLLKISIRDRITVERLQSLLPDQIGFETSHSLSGVARHFKEHTVRPYQEAQQAQTPIPLDPAFMEKFETSAKLMRQYWEHFNLFLRENIDAKTASTSWELLKPQMTALAESKGIRLNITGEESLASIQNLSGSFRNRQLYFVLDNLIQNAIKYTQAPGQVSVGFSLTQIPCKGGVTDRGLILTVQDEGMGIPPDEHQKVLAGGRSDAALASGIPGTGYGLQRTAKHVRDASGLFTLESPLHPESKTPGTRMSARVPLAEPPQRPGTRITCNLPE